MRIIPCLYTESCLFLPLFAVSPSIPVDGDSGPFFVFGSLCFPWPQSRRHTCQFAREQRHLQSGERRACSVKLLLGVCPNIYSTTTPAQCPHNEDWQKLHWERAGTQGISDGKVENIGDQPKSLCQEHQMSSKAELKTWGRPLIKSLLLLSRFSRV